METFEAFLKFVNSYPSWAKFAIVSGLLFSLAVAILSPRITNSAKEAKEQKTDKTTYLKIEEVKLYPQDENVDIQVYAIVNSTRYKHPSVAGVEWMKVGPSMSHKIIELPKSEQYEIRFELKYKSGESDSAGETKNLSTAEKDMMSQMIIQVVEYPFSETYNLYKVDDNTRASSISASIDYSLYQK